MKIRLELTGTSPLLMHNVRLRDPDDPIVREMKIYTAKKSKMTEDDRKKVERLEWYGGLYVGEEGVVIPTSNIRKCLINAGKISRHGTAVARAVNFADLDVPLVYEGTNDIDKLFEDSTFHHRAAVKVGTDLTMRVRPQFPKWSVVAEAEFLEDAMDPDDLRLVTQRAGIAEGLGDGRVLGFGRFIGEVVVL